jgi:cell division protein FtsL
MRFFVLAVAAVAVLTWCGVRVVTQRHRAVALGYDIATATGKQHGLEDELRRLEIDRAALLAPGRLVEIAQAAGLRDPSGDQIVRINLRRAADDQ